MNKSSLVLIVSILCFTFGYLFYANFQHTSRIVNVIFFGDIQSNKIASTATISHSKLSFFNGYNGTHLWSWKLADRNYFQIANTIPCRAVNYTGGPPPSTIDSCDKSDNNEFSLPNLIKAQKWIYEHQHPADCSNKRFAIIHQTASSGFGSTVHQIAWAFGMALSEDRIAVYKSPGNWVMTYKNASFFLQIIISVFSYMAIVSQSILIACFYQYHIVPFHQLLMVIKLFISDQILVIGINLYIHRYFRIEHLIGIEHN